MMFKTSNRVPSLANRQQKQGGSLAAVLALVAVLALGLGIVAFYRSRSAVGEKQQISLSPGTRTVLAQVSEPIDIRFYSMLDATSVSESLKAFAGKVDELLSVYEREGSGKLKVTRVTEPSDSNATDASAHGMRPFNLEKGGACYLGITLECAGKRESLPHLDPAWESAVESDLSRAIERLANSTKPNTPTLAKAADPTLKDEVKKVVPDVEKTSTEEGARLIREAALDEFAAAAKEMERQIKEAQESVTLAKSPAEQEAATQRLRQVQLEQTEKLKEIAARSQERVEALKAMKNGR